MIKFKEIVLALILITSCSNIPLPLYEYGYEAFKEGYFNLDSREIDEDYFKDQKFDSIKVRFGSSRSIIMVLLSSNNGIKEWISSDKIKIYTFNGKIVKTIGLPNDIELSAFQDMYSFNESLSTDSYTVDFYEPILLSQLAKSEMKSKGAKKIKNVVKGRDQINASYYEEKVYIEGFNWSSKNQFFLLEGNVVMSKQKIHPFLKEISIEYIDAYWMD